MKWEADVSARQAVFKQPTINQQLKNIFSLKIKTESRKKTQIELPPDETNLAEVQKLDSIAEPTAEREILEEEAEQDIERNLDAPRKGAKPNEPASDVFEALLLAEATTI